MISECARSTFHAPDAFGAHTSASPSAVCCLRTPSASTPDACQTLVGRRSSCVEATRRAVCADSAVSQRPTSTNASGTCAMQRCTASRERAPRRDVSASACAPRCASQRAVSTPRPPVPP
eukprot:3311099-Prymnesium_polylepis.4